MGEEYKEYKGRHNKKRKSIKKNTNYIRKLFVQALFSAVIFSLIISPEMLGFKYGSKIKEAAKTALFFTVKTEELSKVFKNIYPHKGEILNEEDQTSKNL